jgi:membrane protease YdiL (CAAX protease family)
MAAYTPAEPSPMDDHRTAFKLATGNKDFRISTMTWLALLTFLVFYPALSMLDLVLESGDIGNWMDQELLVLFLVLTVCMQWGLFLINYVALWRERTGFAGIGLVRPRMVDFAWAIAFLFAANVVLSALAWGLAQIGLPADGDISWIIPQDTTGRIIWLIVSFTAGFCEEVAFRGYLMTRLRLILGTKTWVVPVIITSLAFGLCHGYQGWGNMVLIASYGVMFALLFIRTGRLWPLIIAHTLNDIGAQD